MGSADGMAFEDDFPTFRPPQRWPTARRQASAPTLCAPPTLFSHRFSFERAKATARAVAAAAVAAAPPPRLALAVPPPPLPSDALMVIMALCSPQDAARAAQTCRAWCGAFRSPGAWTQLDLTSAGPFGSGGKKEHREQPCEALGAFLAFLLADAGERLSCLRHVALEHTGGTAAQLCELQNAAKDPNENDRQALSPCLLSWEAVAPLLSAASLRSMALHGPPSAVLGSAAPARPLLLTGTSRDLSRPAPCPSTWSFTLWTTLPPWTLTCCRWVVYGVGCSSCCRGSVFGGRSCDPGVDAGSARPDDRRAPDAACHHRYGPNFKRKLQIAAFRP